MHILSYITGIECDDIRLYLQCIYIFVLHPCTFIHTYVLTFFSPEVTSKGNTLFSRSINFDPDFHYYYYYRFHSDFIPERLQEGDFTFVFFIKFKSQISRTFPLGCQVSRQVVWGGCSVKDCHGYDNLSCYCYSDCYCCCFGRV